jgi:dienelactone hydrolase
VQHDRSRRAQQRAREQRRRKLRRRRQVALALTLLLCAGVAALIALVAIPALHGTKSTGGSTQKGSGHHTTVEVSSSTTNQHVPPPGPPFAVGVRTMRFVDVSRTVTYANGSSGPRVLNTEVRYPAARPGSGYPAIGSPGERAVPNAQPQLASGPFPLIVFGHGFELLPVDYHRLLNAWASAGYVVASPIFPDENTDAPGGPDEQDLPNQPRDMKFVISQMQAASSASTGPLSGLVAGEDVAVAGHSDGGDTALTVAYDEYEGIRDQGVKAAVILSGAEMRALPPIAFPADGPPLLAVQGTADRVNQPGETAAYFQAAKPPKYLLELIGAQHLPPYTAEEPQLRIVQRASIDFLNRYLKQRSGSLQAMAAAGSVPGVSILRTYR